MGESRNRQTGAIDTVQFLVGSAVRVRLLASLSEQRQDARTLVERLDVPHSTVQRNLTKLEERGWIDVTVNRRYYATPVGEMVLDALDGLLGTVDAVDGLAAFVESVPFDAIEIDLETLAGGECVVADSETPAAPLSEFVDLLADAAGFTLTTPHWNPAFSDVIERQLDAGNDVDLVTGQSQKRLLTGNGVAGIDEHIGDENLSVSFTDSGLRLGVALADDEVALVGYREGAPRVLVRSDDPDVRSWARSHVHGIDAETHLKESAEPSRRRARGRTNL
jgi:predicted transcriptional regulator